MPLGVHCHPLVHYLTSAVHLRGIVFEVATCLLLVSLQRLAESMMALLLLHLQIGTTDGRV
jgi:hypothetical protein